MITREQIHGEAFRIVNAGWKYEKGGREPGAVDCFGLARILLSRVGIEIPDYPTDDSEAEKLRRFLDEAPKHFKEVSAGCEMPGDLVYLLEPSGEFHLAVILGDGYMAHCLKNGPAITRCDMPPFNKWGRGFYRFAGEALPCPS